MRLGYKKYANFLSYLAFLAQSFTHSDGARCRIVSGSVEKPTGCGLHIEKPKEECHGSKVGLQTINSKDLSPANNSLGYFGIASPPSQPQEDCHPGCLLDCSLRETLKRSI